MGNLLLDKVNVELARYAHPLFEFTCQEADRGVELTIGLKIRGIYDQSYSIRLTERDITEPQFRWSFQRLLYNCLHDYVVEMFEKTPQSKSDTR